MGHFTKLWDQVLTQLSQLYAVRPFDLASARCQFCGIPVAGSSFSVEFDDWHRPWVTCAPCREDD